MFLTYPFVDEVVGRDPQVARNLHMGDYTNLSVKLDLVDDPVSLPTLPTGPADRLPTDAADQPADDRDPVILGDVAAAACSSGDITSTACQKVLARRRRSCSASSGRSARKQQEPGQRPVCQVLERSCPSLPCPAAPAPARR